MNETTPVMLSDEIVSRWQEWTDIVGLIASRDQRRYAVDPQQYHDLHAALLGGIREQLESSDPEKRQVLLQLKDILEPWIYLDSLDQADCEIVGKLADRCKSITASLVEPTRAQILLKKPWVMCILWGLAGITIVGILLLWGGTIGGALLASPQQWFRRTLRMIGGDTTSQMVILGGILVTLAAIGLISRSAN